jgi:hypothetical protein
MSIQCKSCNAPVSGIVCEFCGTPNGTISSVADELQAVDEFLRALGSVGDGKRYDMIQSAIVPRFPESALRLGLGLIVHVRVSNSAATEKVDVIVSQMEATHPTHPDTRNLRAAFDVARETGRKRDIGGWVFVVGSMLALLGLIGLMKYFEAAQCQGDSDCDEGEVCKHDDPDRPGWGHCRKGHHDVAKKKKRLEADLEEARLEREAEERRLLAEAKERRVPSKYELPTSPASHQGQLTASVAVEPKKPDGSAWDADGGGPDLQLCLSTGGVAKCWPTAEQLGAAPGGGAATGSAQAATCQDKTKCELKVDMPSKAERVMVEVFDLDPGARERVGSGECALRARCKVGSATVELTPVAP